ncbi:MAG: hypothetical protein ABIQ40_02080 [Bacteroidia bacterium]
MKPSTFIFTCCVALVAMLVLLGCATADGQRKHIEYAVMIDLTDSIKVVPDENSVVSDLGIDGNIWSSVNFSLGNFTDVSYTPRAHLSLAKAPGRLSASEFTRKREVVAFKATLTTLLDSARSDTSGKPNSSLYLPIVEELTRLSNSTADRKVLVIFSDLMENSPDVSFYSPNTLALLRTNPDKVKAMLFAKAKLPNLKGIEIKLIYQPKNAKDDAVFRTVSQFFSSMFTEAGATVTISANLTNQ